MATAGPITATKAGTTITTTARASCCLRLAADAQARVTACTPAGAFSFSRFYFIASIVVED